MAEVSAFVHEEGRPALEILDRVAAEEPENAERDVPEAVRQLVRLRDGLIERRRKDAGDTAVNAALTRTNSILSCIIGAEFPLQGFHGERMRQARDALKAMLDET